MREITIFLSSTFRDLQSTRESVSKFLSVLKPTLSSMEIFGSDERKPKDYCLEQVRKSNYFIGIYAARYGSIDEESGVSITQLEYIEAYERLKRGELKALLVYIINEQASWPIEFVDRDPVAVEKFAIFKKMLASRHTVTFFQSAEELPFQILTDVIRKIGLGIDDVFRGRKYVPTPRRNSLTKPIGMEFYTEEYQKFFCGRSTEIKRLFDQTVENSMSLLIGDSGSGKTSLINAGLLPLLHKLGWRTAMLRPLNEPTENLKRSLWTQLLEGMPPNECDFTFVAKTVSATLSDRPMLIVIDQFEDILSARNPADADKLCASLLELYRSADPNIRFLLSYRADVEANVGPLWQSISGSADGLPRAYLGPLTKEGCREALSASFKSLKVAIDGTPAKGSSFLDVLTEELFEESLHSGYSGVFPPFVQMLVASAFRASKDGSYSESEYSASGSVKGIIADFLIQQLRYFGTDEADARRVLIALVSSYGRKAQKTFGDISLEAGLAEPRTELLLKKLISLRMVRIVNEQYEIVHDFLAKRILSEITSTEEREAKKFKDLLTSRAHAFTNTYAPLTLLEYLHIYKFRNRIHCSEVEVSLLIHSALLLDLPAKFWLRYVTPKQISEIFRQLLRTADNAEYERNLIRMAIDTGHFDIPFSKIYGLFLGWKYSDELSEYIRLYAKPGDLSILLKLYTKGSPSVVESIEAFACKHLSLADSSSFEVLLSKPQLRKLFEVTALSIGRRLSIFEVRSLIASEEEWQRLIGIAALGERGSRSDLGLLLSTKSTRRKSFKIIRAKSILQLAQRTKQVTALQQLLMEKDEIWDTARFEFDFPPSTQVRTLLKNLTSINEYQAYVILHNARTSDLAILKKALLELPMNSGSAQKYLIDAICKFGGQREFDFFLKKVMKGALSVESTQVKAIAKLATKHNFESLERMIDDDGFWWRGKFTWETERPANFHCVLWIVGAAYCELSGRRQFSTLKKLISHPYWTVRQAAADAILRFATSEDLEVLVNDAISSRSNEDALLRVLRTLESKTYSIESER